MCADSRFAKPQNSLQGDEFILFASAKRTKKHAQRAFSVEGGAPTPRKMPRSGILVATATRISAAGGKD